jgi:hypothetical protein
MLESESPGGVQSRQVIQKNWVSDFLTRRKWSQRTKRGWARLVSPAWRAEATAAGTIMSSVKKEERLKKSIGARVAVDGVGEGTLRCVVLV